MTIKFFLVITIPIICVSCAQVTNKMPDNSFKDSVLTKYFREIDSTGEYDTSDLNYKALKAYYVNDTSFFKKMNEDVENDKQFRESWKSVDSCIKQPELQKLDVDEAYRFTYDMAFC